MQKETYLAVFSPEAVAMEEVVPVDLKGKNNIYIKPSGLEHLQSTTKETREAGDDLQWQKDRKQ